MDSATLPSSPVPPAGPPRRPRRRHLLPLAAALLGLTVAAAACSSDPASPGVAGAGSTPTTSASNANQASSGPTAAQRAAELAYSQCMRAHGVTNFPDPGSNGAISIQGSSGNGTSNGLDPNNPTFQNAQKACQSKLPAPTPAQQAQAMQNALKISRCMRAHGIKDYPDPSSSGGRVSISINGSPSSDLNPNNPAFQRAQAACMPNAPKPGSGNKTSGSPGSGSSQIGVFGS